MKQLKQQKGNCKRSTHELVLTAKDIEKLKDGESLRRIVWREPVEGGTQEFCISVRAGSSGADDPGEL